MHATDFWRNGRLFVLLLLVVACKPVAQDRDAAVSQIHVTLDGFHEAAARADYAGYFGYFADDSSVFIGTDATEHWTKPAFMAWSKPYFDRGKAWNFKAVQRHIYLDEAGQVAWFDELLDTQMKICRGSGVLVRSGDTWKVRHYVLSTTIPNSLIDSVTVLKTAEEDSLLRTWRK